MDVGRAPETLLAAGARLVFGELHGTAEIPAAIGRLLDHAAHLGLAVVLALELPELTRVADYVAGSTPPGLDLVDLSGWWQTTDGRSSVAMAALIDDARRLARHHDLTVACLDTAMVHDRADLHERERHLADRLVEVCTAARGACILALVGSIHGWLDDTEHLNGGPSMATLAQRAVPDLCSIGFEHHGGHAWIITDPTRPAGPTPIPCNLRHHLPPGVHLWDNVIDHVNAVWALGTTITASPPLVRNR